LLDSEHETSLESCLQRMFGLRQSAPYLNRWDEELATSANGQDNKSDSVGRVDPSDISTYKQDFLSKLPDTLLLQLKRFQFVSHMRL